MKQSSGMHGVPYSLIEIKAENMIAIDCVLEEASQAGHLLHIRRLTKQQAEVFDR